MQVHPDHAYLKAEMLDYAQSALCHDEDGKKKLTLCVNAFDRELEQLARASGFVQAAGLAGCDDPV